MTVLNGSYYAIPLAVEGVLTPTNFTLNFDPAKITFVGMMGSAAILPLPSHSPGQGVIAYSFHGSPSTNNPTRTGIAITPRFEAVASGDTTILIAVSHNFRALTAHEQSINDENTITDYDIANSNVRAIETAILASTLGNAIGMQGFEGEYTIDSPDEIIEIIVQFVTPPSVALRLIHERGIFTDVALLSGVYFEEQALMGHTAFRQQLSEISDGGASDINVEIFGTHHCLFNGVFMRVPGSMVNEIAELPEVFAVFPNSEHYVDTIPYNDNDDSFLVPMSNFPHNNTARELFEIDFIHNTLGFTGRGIKVAVLDSGIDYNHPDLRRYRDPATNRIRGWDFVRNNNDPMDVYGHGTHVSGTIVAMAPDVELWHFRVLDDNNRAGASSLNRLMDSIIRWNNSCCFCG